MVTVTDPRHPLYGQTFHLSHIANKQYLGRCCVVWPQEGIERNIPVEATDRSTEPFTIFPLPLDLSSLRQLLVAFEGIKSQEKLMEEKEDGSIQAINGCSDEDNIRGSRVPRANLALANRSSTTNVVSDCGTDVSHTDEIRQRQACDGGREDEL
jgi:hypothetical protein